MMHPLVRVSHSPSNSKCAIHSVLDRLAFDPTVQDQVWHRAQQLRGRERAGPYSTAMCKCCRKKAKGALEALDALGVGVDPVTQTLLAGHAYEGTPRLMHKNLFLAGMHDEQPMSCSTFLEVKPTANRIQLLAELAAAVQYLHSQSHIHGSIRPDAAFVDDEGSALLAYDDDKENSTGSVEDGYLAPELESGDAQPSTASDVYAFGGLVHWMCTGGHPAKSVMHSLPTAFDSLSLSSSVAAMVTGSLSTITNRHIILNDFKKTLTEQTEHSLRSLVAQCRRANPEQRPPMVMVSVTLQQILVRHRAASAQLTMGLSLERGLAMGWITSLAAFLPKKKKTASKRTESTCSTPNLPAARMLPPSAAPLTSSGQSLAVPYPIPRSASYNDLSRLQDQHWVDQEAPSPRSEHYDPVENPTYQEAQQTRTRTAHHMDEHQYPSDPFADDIAYLERQRSSARRNDLRVHTGGAEPPRLVLYQPPESPKTPAPPWTPFPMHQTFPPLHPTTQDSHNASNQQAFFMHSTITRE